MKIRLDQYMVDNHLAISREKAKALIMAKKVYVNNEPAIKAGLFVKDTDLVEVKGESLKYVSRAGYKLEKALSNFVISVKDLVCLDIGASTGGFTDCLLQNEAKLVYALDVGTNQLDWKLRSDERVISLEKVNFRYVDKELFNHEIQFACCDVSFISLDKIIPKLKEIIVVDSYAVLLIKPQFETIREKVSKGGVVNVKETHFEVIKKIVNLALTNGFSFINLDYSPILGNKKANIEFLSLIQLTASNPMSKITDKDINSVIDLAWKNLKDK